MSDIKRFSPHITAITAICILGGSVINLPLAKANEFTFTGFLVSAIIFLSGFLILSLLADKLLNDTTSVWANILIGFFYLRLAVFALFCGGAVFESLISFATEIILPNTGAAFVTVILGATTVYFALKRQENVLKFALISFSLCAAIVVFFFIATMENYDLRNIYVFRLPEFSDLKSQTLPYLKETVLTSWLLPFYLKFTFGKAKTGRGFLGAVIGIILLGLCVLTSVLLFGSKISGQLDFPFNSAVSTVSVGRLFTRLDGFAYFVYFVSGLIKITVCIFISVHCLKNLSKIIDKKRSTQ